MDFSIKAFDTKNTLAAAKSGCVAVGVYENKKLSEAAQSLDATLPPAALPRMAIRVQVTRMENRTVKLAPATLANSRCRARRKIIR